jgi:hypothetical protein
MAHATQNVLLQVAKLRLLSALKDECQSSYPITRLDLSDPETPCLRLYTDAGIGQRVYAELEPVSHQLMFNGDSAIEAWVAHCHDAYRVAYPAGAPKFAKDIVESDTDDIVESDTDDIDTVPVSPYCQVLECANSAEPTASYCALHQ